MQHLTIAPRHPSIICSSPRHAGWCIYQETRMSITTHARTAIPPALTLADILPDLIAPFPTTRVEIKPGATTADKSRALALVYLKVQPIEQRLDDLVGPEHWSNQ